MEVGLNRQDFFRLCYKQRFHILSIIIAFMLIGWVYTAYKKPIYESRAYIVKADYPNQLTYSLVESMNWFYTVYNLNLETTDWFYALFVKALTSEETKRNFLNELLKSKQLSPKMYRKSLIRLHQFLNVRSLEAFTPGSYAVYVRSKNPLQSQLFLKMYLAYAEKRAKKSMREFINKKNTLAVYEQELKIAVLHGIARIKQQYRIQQLKSALAIAQAAGIHDPWLLSAPKKAKAMLPELEALYLLGTKALKKEIAELEKRTSDVSYIPKLPELKNQLRILALNKKFHNEDFKVYKQESLGDMRPVKIEPDKGFILMLAFFVGIMIAALTISLRYLFEVALRMEAPSGHYAS